MSNEQQQAQVWDDEEIYQFLKRTLGKENIQNAQDAVFYSFSAVAVIVESYRQRITELEASLEDVSRIADESNTAALKAHQRIDELEAQAANWREAIANLAASAYETVEDNELLKRQLAAARQQHAECTTALITEERRVNRLRNELAAAQQWEPVSGEIDECLLVVGDKLLFLDELGEAEITLPEGYAICQRKGGAG